MSTKQYSIVSKLYLSGIEIVKPGKGPAFVRTLNCTLVELKYDPAYIKTRDDGSLNCTLVELKYSSSTSSSNSKASLNCTLVELKLKSIFPAFTSRTALNCTLVELKYLTRDHLDYHGTISKLYLSGIEIGLFRFKVNNSHLSLNCTLVELKSKTHGRPIEALPTTLNCTLVELK